MTTKKHNLTAHKDHITGGKGADLFIGTKGTLASNDVLDGGKGTDMVSATLSGKLVAPVMANIEKGSFTLNSKTDVVLDLAHAEQMRQITIHDAGVLSNNSVGLDVRHAAHVSSVALRDIGFTNSLSVSGIDASAVRKEAISFDHVTSQVMTLNTIGHAAFATLDLSLNRTLYTTLAGDVAARSLRVHTHGKEDSYLEIAPTGKHDVHDMTVDGVADVSFALNASSFDKLASFNASALKAGATVTLESHSLRLVNGGSGDDAIIVNALGGTAAKKAVVSMGDGDDLLDVSGFQYNSAKMHFSGGKGYDTIQITGSSADIGAVQDGFEALSIVDAVGTYNLGSGWKGFTLANTKDATASVIVQDGSGLTSVLGSIHTDLIRLDEVGGTAAHKGVVDLGGGDDTLSLNQMTLNASTQSFKGGDGTDTIGFTGNVANLGALFHGFEYGLITNATGTYDIGDSGITLVNIISSQGVLAFNNVKSDSSTWLQTSQPTLMTVNVLDAATRTDDSHTIQLFNNADLGNSVVGLNAPDLSILNIYGSTNPHTVYLSTVGSVSDAATLNIHGNGKVTLEATTGSTSYIDGIISDNSAGLDMTGLLDGSKALVSTGVTIVGGSGNDVLVGGTGADTIIAGAGADTVHGSLGIDHFNLSGGGADTLVFNSQTQSALMSGDTIEGFNIFKGIDISALVSSVAFGGNVSTVANGVATLSTNHSVAFFCQADDTLYLDVNHDGVLTSNFDMEFNLQGLDTFAASSLVF
jgi:hypothetical protein